MCVFLSISWDSKHRFLSLFSNVHRRLRLIQSPPGLFCLYVGDEQLPSYLGITWDYNSGPLKKITKKGNNNHLAMLSDLFGTVKRPEIKGTVTSNVRESTGSGLESTGNQDIMRCFHCIVGSFFPSKFLKHTRKLTKTARAI